MSYTLTLGIADAQTLIRALARLPLDEVLPLYQNVLNQLRMQEAEANVPVGKNGGGVRPAA